MFLLLKHRIKCFASVIISPHVSALLKVRDKMLQSWHSPSFLVFFLSLHTILILSCFSGRSTYRSFSGNQRTAVRSRSRRSRDDHWTDIASTSASTSGPSSAATSGASRSSKRHHRSSTSSAATATVTAASVMGGSVSSKLDLLINTFFMRRISSIRCSV